MRQLLHVIPSPPSEPGGPSWGCPRCHNVMVEEYFQDLRDDTGSLRFKGWRCIICGEILDPIILQNRASRPKPLGGRARPKKAVIQVG